MNAQKIVAWLFLLISISLANFGIAKTYSTYIEKLKSKFLEEQDLIGTKMASSITSEWLQIYQGLRTISRMPDVQRIDRYGKNFDNDAKKVVQELYNNLNANTKFSELYIVPENLDPEKIDKITKKLQEPIITFDKIILGKFGGEKKPESPIPEVEIYEYRLMAKQNAWFRANFSRLVPGHEFEIPMLTGPEVITCDNSNYDPVKKDDKARSGIVFSVPFFTESGKFKGLISGIVLTSHLVNIFPDQHFTLLSEAHGFEAYKNTNSIVAPFIFNKIYPIKINDPMGDWKINHKVPEEEFYRETEVVQAGWIFIMAGILSTGILVLGFIYMRKQILLQQREQEKAKYLNSLVNEKVAEIQAKDAMMLENARLASLGEMSSGIAHEINNPLSIMLLSTEQVSNLLSADELSREELKINVDRISRMIKRITKIVNGMRNLSRDSSKDPFTKYEFKNLISETLELCEKKLASCGVELRISQIPDVLIECRPVEITQVLSNLIGNAVDAIQLLNIKWVELKFDLSSSDRIKICVIDSGNKIPDSIAEKLSQPFFTTKAVGKGTGLGLSISRRIAESHNGKFYLDRNAAHTCFVLELPMQQSASLEQKAS